MAKFILKKNDQFVKHARRVVRYSDKTGKMVKSIDLIIGYTSKEKQAATFKTREEVDEILNIAKSIKNVDLYASQIEM